MRADKLFAQSLKQLYPTLSQTDNADEVVTYVEYVFCPTSNQIGAYIVQA